MEVNKIISHALQSMPPSKRQKAFAKDTSKLIHMGLNENNYGMSPKAVAALEDSMAGSHFYPDFAAVLLKQKVAEQYGLKAENVLTGAGSSAMIDMIGLTFLDEGDEVLFSAPTYGAFADMAYLNGGVPVSVPVTEEQKFNLPAMKEKIGEKTKIVVICNPNNPTGTYVPIGELEAFADTLPEDVLLVMDEAYMEFATEPDCCSMVDYMKAHPEKPILVLRTFSKYYAMAGLRVGYALGSEELIGIMRKCSASWNLNVCAQKAAVAGLADQEYYQEQKAKIVEGREYLEKGFYIPMNKKKRRVAVLLSATIGSAVLVLSGCSGKSDQTEKTLRVGVITYTQDDPFINGLTDELKAQLKAMENKERRIIVSTKSGNDDQQEQNEKVEEMIDAGCDVLCINLVDRTAPSRIIRMARNEDIPVIFFNREPVREDLMQWEKLYYVGCDAEQSGIMQGEIAEEYIKSHPEVDKNQDGKIQYVLLEGEAGHQDAISRTEYSVKTLMKNDVILEKLSYQLADWNRGQAENRMNRLISQYGKKIELVMSNNDEMALGAVEAYRKAGYVREEWPVIFGIDGLEEALEAVKAGEMQGSILNDRVDQAKKMAKMAVELFEGEEFEQESLKEGRYYFSEYQKVDGSNIDEYLNAEETISHSGM